MIETDKPTPSEIERDARPLEPSLLKRFLSRFALVGGILIALSFVLPASPSDQELVFRFGDGAERIRKLEASFTKSGERDARNGFTLNFPNGAPARTKHKVSLPNGDYVIAVAVERADDGGAKETSFERRVSLQGGETVLPLETLE